MCPSENVSVAETWNCCCHFFGKSGSPSGVGTHKETKSYRPLSQASGTGVSVRQWPGTMPQQQRTARPFGINWVYFMFYHVQCFIQWREDNKKHELGWIHLSNYNLMPIVDGEFVVAISRQSGGSRDVPVVVLDVWRVVHDKLWCPTRSLSTLLGFHSNLDKREKLTCYYAVKSKIYRELGSISTWLRPPKKKTTMVSERRPRSRSPRKDVVELAFWIRIAPFQLMSRPAFLQTRLGFLEKKHLLSATWVTPVCKKLAKRNLGNLSKKCEKANVILSI